MNRPLPERDRAVILLQQAGAPRVLTPITLDSWLAGNGLHMTQSALARAVDIWSQTRVIIREERGLYLNNQAHPWPVAEEIAPHLCSGAIISLQMVLGRDGVLNNPTERVTCVVPGLSGDERTHETAAGTIFRFQPIAAAMVPTPDQDWYGLSFETYAHTPTATREKALLDWLHLATHDSGWSVPPFHDLDWDELDEERLAVLADRMKLTDVLDRFRSGGGRYRP